MTNAFAILFCSILLLVPVVTVSLWTLSALGVGSYSPCRPAFLCIVKSNNQIIFFSLAVVGWWLFHLFAWHEGAVWVSNHPVILSLASFSLPDSYLAEFLHTHTHTQTCIHEQTLSHTLSDWMALTARCFGQPRHGTEKHKGFTSNQHHSTQDLKHIRYLYLYCISKIHPYVKCETLLNFFVKAEGI